MSSSPIYNLWGPPLLVLDSVNFALPLLFGDKVHYVTIYERYGFTGEVGAGIGIESSGTHFQGRLTCQDQSPLCGMVCLGDAAHPMMPDQDQGFIQSSNRTCRCTRADFLEGAGEGYWSEGETWTGAL